MTIKIRDDDRRLTLRIDYMWCKWDTRSLDVRLLSPVDVYEYRSLMINLLRIFIDSLKRTYLE